MNPILARFADEPSFVAPTRSAWFTNCLECAVTAMESYRETIAGAILAEGFWPHPDSPMASIRPYQVSGGVLTIPVRGALLNGFPYAFGGCATGYDYISRAFERGMADPDVRGIALAIDSPGGTVAGLFDLTDAMAARRGEKPIRAYASEGAYSAAYAIATAADTITVTRSGGVGSIGVVTMHVDHSAALAEDGVKVTFIYAGAHKVDGNSFEPLPDAVKAKIQGRVDALYDEFTSTVARNRKMDERAVRDTEAESFTASEAISNGLADSIGSLESSLAAFSADLSTEEGGSDDMPDFAQADLDTARAEGLTLGLTEGATAERARIAAIIGSDAGKARPKAALSASLKTDMGVEDAQAFLADLPEEKAEAAPAAAAAPTAGAPAGMFEAAMNGSGNPDLGAGSGDEAPRMSVADRIMASAGKKRRA